MLVHGWNITAKSLGDYLYDVFVDDRFYRRVKWDRVKLTKVESVPCGSPIYFPSITELEQACSQAH